MRRSTRQSSRSPVGRMPTPFLAPSAGCGPPRPEPRRSTCSKASSLAATAAQCRHSKPPNKTVAATVTTCPSEISRSTPVHRACPACQWRSWSQRYWSNCAAICARRMWSESFAAGPDIRPNPGRGHCHVGHEAARRCLGPTVPCGADADCAVARTPGECLAQQHVDGFAPHGYPATGA